MICSHQLSKKFQQQRAGFQHYAIIQNILGQRLLDRLNLILIKPKKILVLESHLPLFLKPLKQKYPLAEINSNTLCDPNFERIDFPNNQYDLIFVHNILPWIFNTPKFLHTLNKRLAPNGVVLLSSFGPNTLLELKKAWANLDTQTHINPFADLQTLGNLLAQAQFQNPVVDKQIVYLEYEQLCDLLIDLKQTGCVLLKRAHLGLSPKSLLSNLEKAFTSPFKIQFELIFCIGWKSNQLSVALNLI